MQCDMVVGLILYKGAKGKKELDTCDSILALRNSQKYVSFKFDCEVSMEPDGGVITESALLENLVLLASAWVNSGRLASGGLGLYIQAHGDASNIDVTLDFAVKAAKLLYDHSLRFRKINLGWCFSGGQQGFYDPSAGTGVKFIKSLKDVLGAEGQENLQVAPIHKLEGTLFSCYYGTITYKDENDIAQIVSKSYEKDESVELRPRNVSLRSGRLIHPHAQMSGKVRQKLETVNGNTFNDVKSKIGSIDKNIKAALDIVVEYLARNKSAWKVVGNNVVRTGLDEYSDVEYIKLLHAAIVVTHAQALVN